MMHRPVHCVVPIEGGLAATLRAARTFAGPPHLWLPPPATPASTGHRVRLEMPGPLATPDVMALVYLGTVLHPRRDMSVRSIQWRAETAHDIFPVLHGDLELHAHDATELRLTGSYTPPLSVLGALTDQVVGRHLASEVVRAFTAEVAHRLVHGSERSVDRGPAPTMAC